MNIYFKNLNYTHMPPIPAYCEKPVPDDLQIFVRRLLLLKYSSQAETVIIPARPTGQIYIGCLLEGTATAAALGNRFALAPQQVHISGQLSTFEAEYTLTGPATHILAECTPTGAFRLLQRDLGPLQNRVEIMDMKETGSDPVQALVATLRTLASNAHPEDLRIAQAAQLIENANGLVNITVLAEELGMSDRNLRREFTRVVGIAPKPFAMIKRVLFALQTLAVDPDADLADIVYDGGFTDQAHMTKMFQLYLRSTPRRLALDHDGVLQSIVARA